MGTIEEYRARRAKRLAMRVDAKKEEIDKVAEFKKRRAARLAARGIRMDAPEGTEENNNNQGGGGSKGGGGHGNTRLPFGLCKRFGIDIGPSWTPKDAWAALAGKGITPEKAFEALKKGGDPGATGEKEVPEVKKEPVKTIVVKGYGGATYGDISGYISSGSRGVREWRLRAKRIESGTGYSPYHLFRTFATKMDMMEYLKESGIEEFSDPETGEVVNPQNIDIPKSVLKIPGGAATTSYTALSLGLRDGRYFLTGTDYDGKKKKIGDWRSKADAEEFVTKFGGKVDDIKLSPALKKRETERLSWMKSDKKEYFEKDGKKYGDVTLIQSGSVWHLQGESEDGEKTYVTCRTKTAAMKFLKEQGVQKVRLGKESLNPTEYEIPKTVATYRGIDYQKLEFEVQGEQIFLMGTDLDGARDYIGRSYYDESYDDFKKRIFDKYGFEDSQITIDDKTRERIAEKQKRDVEKAKRKAEFEAKAESWGYSRYADVEIGKDSDGDLAFYGYDEDGQKKKFSFSGDWYSIKQYLSRYGRSEEDLQRYIKNGDVRRSYEEYQKGIKEFEARAKKFGGKSYANIRVSYVGGNFVVHGIDERGRKSSISYETSFADLEKMLGAEGYTVDMLDVDEDAAKRIEIAKKAKEAIATGKYYALGRNDEAYTDIRIEQDSDGWKIIGKSVDDAEHTVEKVGSWNEAVEQMSQYGVSSYKVKDKSGIEMGMPSMGMHSVMLMKKPDGSFSVYADTSSGTHKVVHEAKSEGEARKWLRENNVPDGGVKTRGMNPNDTVVRSVVPKALSKFDTHRMKAIEGTFIDDMSADEKQEVADMLQTVFTQGEYRAARSTRSFLGILENGYKSQIETGHGGSGAAQDILGRKNCSNGMYGHGGLDKTEYEVMGYAAPPDIADDYDSAIHPWYGGRSDLTYTFRKDTLKDRVTYTFGDSLNTYSRGRGELKSAGYAGENPTIEGMTGGGRYATKSAIKAYRNYKNGKINLSQLIRQVSSEANNNYIELQFTGGVTIKDIQKVSFDSEQKIRDAFEGMDADGRKKAIQLLKENKIELDYKANSMDKAFSDGWEWLKQRYPEEFTD